MKKRILAWLLVLALLLSLNTVWADEPETAEEEEQPETYTVEELGYSRSSLTVATVTPLTGCFFTDMWGNGTSDGDVKALLHGYPLTKYDVSTLNYIINDDVVSGYQITKNKNGNHEYNIFLQENLYYSDGSRITAYDYAFSILFQLSPYTAKAGADTPNLDYIVGASDYAAGRSNVLTGVRVINDTQLKITVGKNAYPYYYELSYIAFNPYPASVIMPNARVADDGKGAYIFGAFDEKTVQQTVLGTNGYLTTPKVVSGPYTLASYDGTTAVFKINKYYKGSENAQIKTITYTSVSNEEAAETLSSGKAALIHKAMNADAITDLAQLLSDGLYTMSAYPRSGLSFISFCCEKTGVSDQKVRQAIAMCLDKEALTESAVGSYGTVTDGYYGIGQWMYSLVSGAEQYPTEDGVQLSKWQKLSFDNLKTYEYDPAAAGEYLEKAGWKLNADGVRQKSIGNKIYTLELTLVVAEENNAAEFLQNDFAAALKEAGIALTVQTMPWEDLLKLYYREEERDCDMFYLASNFEANFSPSAWFSTEDSAQGVANKTGLRDEAIYTAARDMERTDSTDALSYCTKWVKWLELVSDRVPVIPVYSNIYFDYYTAALNNYDPSTVLCWPETVYGLTFENVEG